MCHCFSLHHCICYALETSINRYLVRTLCRCSSRLMARILQNIAFNQHASQCDCNYVFVLSRRLLRFSKQSSEAHCLFFVIVYHYRLTCLVYLPLDLHLLSWNDNLHYLKCLRKVTVGFYQCLLVDLVCIFVNRMLYNCCVWIILNEIELTC